MTQVSEPFGHSVGTVLAPEGSYDGILTGNKVRFTRDNTRYEFEINRISKETKNVRIVVNLTKASVYLK